ncbi:MAG TPA: enolase C-terminal domain-like protein [Acidimicrobiales bacterium]|jgi:L-alanine-DL-glutamate epimerase-like enolase superfamily enzyme|nr:enolase C-terminal domain-like protein [Acidimicrobiales bacterium]
MTAVDDLSVSVYTVPTEEAESDGTFTWTATTVVVVEVSGGSCRGLGFTYGSRACATVIDDVLRPVVMAGDASDVPATWRAMVAAVRNIGRPGVASAAIAAVDVALWDLKAKLVGLPLVSLLGHAHDEVAVYGSGGFTSYTDDELADQLGGWVHGDGIRRVKMKIGTAWGSRAERDVERVSTARAAIGDGAELFVDANGAYTAKQAVRLAPTFVDQGVTWFEEPVSSDDLAGLAAIRHMTAMDVAAGEYGSDLAYFQRMCGAGAVDVVQADVSRCAGITEWLRVAALAAAHGLQISGHCAQSLHAHPACAVPNIRHLEYFHDHARVDRILFDGVLDPIGGVLRPDLSRAGIGLELRRSDADPYCIS